jgi:glycosyltransferase involved in cell wall biosynthesis
LSFLLDYLPKLQFKNLVILVNQMAHRLYADGDTRYNTGDIRNNLIEVFGTEGKWAPVSQLVRQLMEEDECYPSPHHENWPPLIDEDRWIRGPLKWRRNGYQRPIVGTHCTADYTKWPSNAENLRNAYLAGRPCEVRFLGGAEQAIEVIGNIPSNWKLFASDSTDVRDFLQSLDFFIHFPHEDSIDESGRCVIEAMATGCPAILTPIFRDTFGGAAIYCKTEEVWHVIKSLWENEAEYLKQAEKGQVFVEQHCRLEELSGRLGRLETA